MRVKIWSRAFRLHQWVKNLLLFVPVLTAHRPVSVALVLRGFQSFVAFGLCASAVYLFNDLVDLKADRLHPTKSRRPLAKGQVSAAWMIVLSLAFILVSIGWARLLSLNYFLILSLYVILNIAYTLLLKRVVLLDALCLASLYSLRIFAGGSVFNVAVTAWLIAFSMFLFLSLALAKRAAELHNFTGSIQQNLSGRGYFPDDAATVQALGASSGCMAVLVLALYIHHPDVSLLYRHPDRLWLICPAIFYWIGRIWLITGRGRMNEDPVLFALSDPPSYAVGVLSLIILSAAR